MKIVFAGTPEFAASSLKTLHEAGHDIALVLTQPDRPAGRGMRLQASAVKRYSLTQNLEVIQPVSLRLDGKFPDEAKAAHARIEAIAPDVMVVAAYGLILPRSILALPRLGCINIHASLLPRWRGAAPIHRAIESGDQETGITIMQMDEGLDTGPMLLSRHLSVARNETTGSLHDKLAALGGEAIVTALKDLEAGRLQAQAQPERGITYAAKVVKEEALIDFSNSASTIARKIRAFNPYPGASAVFGDVSLKLWFAEELGEKSCSAPGTVMQANAEGILVACGEGVIRITELQKAGGKRLSAADFLRAFPMSSGRFGIDE